MQTATDPLDVLHIVGDGAAEGGSLRRAERLEVSVTTPQPDDSWPAAETVDCLVTTTAGGGVSVDTIERLAGLYPSTPLVAFTGDRDDGHVERVIAAGARDIVRSVPSETPPVLIQRRVENVCESEPAPPAASDGPLTDRRMFEYLSENLPGVIWVNNIDGERGNEIEFVSEGYEEIWGRPREYLLEGGSDAFLETIHPADRDQVWENTWHEWVDSGGYEVTYRIVRPDGEIRWIRDRALGTHDDGERRCLVGIARDVTDRKVHEQRLERRNDLFTRAQDIADVGAWEYSLEDENLWTEQIYELLDVPRDRTPTLENVEQFFHPDDWPTFLATLERAVAEAESFDMEVRLLTANDEQRWARVRGDPQTEDGEVVRVRGTLQDITGHKERERELERNRTFLEQIQQVSDVGGWEYDFRTGRIRLDEEACVLDLPSDSTPTVAEMLGNYHPEDRETVQEAIRQLRSDGESFSNEVRVAAEDGEYRWVYTQGEPVYEDDEVVAMRGVSRDITERKAHERQLERQNALFTRAQAIADVGAWERDLEADEIWWTEQINRIYGLPPDYEPEPREGLQYFPPEDRTVIREAYDRAKTEGEPYDVELRVVTDDGTQKWVRARGEPQLEDGEVVRVRGTLQDITGRVEREQRLQAERDLVERILETSPVGIHVYNADGHIVRTNDQAVNILDVDRNTLVGDTAPPTSLEVRSMAGELLPKSQMPIEQVRRTGEPVRDETVLVDTPADEQKVVVVDAVPLFDDGDLSRVVLAFDDVTERVEREQRLQTERDLIERILDMSPVGIHVYDADGRIVRANDQAAKIMGMDRETLEGAKKTPSGLALRPRTGETFSSGTPLQRIMRTGEPVHNEELIVETPAGEERVVVVNGVPLFDDGELERVIAVFDDVTERVDHEQRLETQRDELARLDRINRIIRGVDTALVGATTRKEVEQAVCDQLSESGRYQHAQVFRTDGDGFFLRTAGESKATGLTSKLSTGVSANAPISRAVRTGETQTLQESDNVDDGWVTTRMGADETVNSIAAIPITYGEQTYGVVVVCTAEDTFDERELDVLDELGETVGHAISAVESREREAILTSLYEATQDLLAAETPQDVSDVVVETAASVLDPPGIGIFLFDDEENVLELATGTDTMHEFCDGSTTFGPGYEDSITWQTYISGESQFFTDVRESDHVINQETDCRTGLFLPLGEHGVFVVTTSEQTTFGEQKRRLVGLLGTTTEAALDRVVGQVGIRERDRRLAERTTRLERLERMFGLVDDIEEVLHSAGTREDVEQGFCECVAGTESYSFAWLGRVDADGAGIAPLTWANGETRRAGSEGAYLDDVSLALDGDEPAARALATGEPVRVRNVTDHLREEAWARAAVEHDYESVLAVPLTRGNITHGVFTVYASAPDAFDDVVQSTFERLGETLPHVITRLERDRALLTDRAVELELSVPEPETFMNAVAATVGQEVEYREVTPGSSGRTRVTFTLADPPIEALRDLESELVNLQSLDVLERADETTFRATLTGSTVATTVLSCGAIPRNVVATADRTTVTVRLPHDVDVSLFLDRVAQCHPGVDLRSRRDVEVGARPGAAARSALTEDLTDRQREVLQTAYRSGFFESPRETTGVELADMLGISQPTVTHHLREAQRRLFDALFDDSTDCSTSGHDHLDI